MKKINWINITEILDDTEYWISLVNDILDDEGWDEEKEMVIQKIMSKYNVSWLPDIFERQLYGVVLDILRKKIIEQLKKDEQ